MSAQGESGAYGTIAEKDHRSSEPDAIAMERCYDAMLKEAMAMEAWSDVFEHLTSLHRHLVRLRTRWSLSVIIVRRTVNDDDFFCREAYGLYATGYVISAFVV